MYQEAVDNTNAKKTGFARLIKDMIIDQRHKDTLEYFVMI